MSTVDAPSLWRRADASVVAGLVGLTLAIGLIDPNDQFLTTNDIYIFRQIHHYFDVFSWLPQDVSSVSAVLDKIGRFVFWFFYYFHGAPPAVYQAPLFALMDASGVSFRPLYGQVMVTALFAFTVVLFWSCLRRAALAPAIAAAAALLVVCSPMLTGFSRGFGTMWLANIALCQALSVYAFLRLRESRSQWLSGLTFTHIILSDPISFLLIGPGVVAWIWPDRWVGFRLAADFAWQRVCLLRSWKIWLLPVIAIVTVALWNVLRARYAAVIPGEQTLFVYPFTKYIAGTEQHAAYFGPHDWLRVAIVSFGVWAPIGFPAVLGLAVVMRGGKTSDPFVFRWALISSAGFGLMFYVLSYPNMGSQAMPYIGYPAYTILPFVTLLALALDRLAANDAWRRHLATAVLSIFAAAGLLTTVSYIWQRPLVPGSDLLDFGPTSADFIGLRRPYYGDLAAGAAVRYAIARVAAGAEARTTRLLYVRMPGNARFDIFWMYVGLEYGGRWYDLRFGNHPKFEVLMLEQGTDDAPVEWLLRRIEPVHRSFEGSTVLASSVGQACPVEACVVLDTTGEASDDELLRRVAQAPDLQIRRGNDAPYNISIIGDRSLLPLTGSTDGRDLENNFRRDFPSLWDYIPPPNSQHFLKKFQDAVAHK